MANELPYFRFTVQAWQNGNISLERFELQGLFISICGFYWINDCSILLKNAEKKFRGNESNISELINLGIIKHNKKTDLIRIDFLNNQYDLLSSINKNRVNAGKNGGIKGSKWSDEARKKGNQLYVILMSDKKESFIKVGRTSISISQRYSISNGYDIDVLFQDFDNIKKHSIIENELSLKFPYDYTPNKNFGGHTECFKIESLKEIEILLSKILCYQVEIQDKVIQNSKAFALEFGSYKDKNKDKNKDNSKYNFKESLLEYGFEKKLIEDWLDVRKTKKATNTETAFNGFVSELEKRKEDKNKILKFIVEKGWSGFKWSWYDNENKTTLISTYNHDTDGLL